MYSSSPTARQRLRCRAACMRARHAARARCAARPRVATGRRCSCARRARFAWTLTTRWPRWSAGTCCATPISTASRSRIISSRRRPLTEPPLLGLRDALSRRWQGRDAPCSLAVENGRSRRARQYSTCADLTAQCRGNTALVVATPPRTSPRPSTPTKPDALRIVSYELFS